MRAMREWIANESGQAGTEYALILFLISVCVVVAIMSLSEGIKKIYNERITSKIMEVARDS